MTDTKYAKLREAASYAANEVLRSHGWEGTVSGADFFLAADERYLLAASPDVILSLLGERDALLAALAGYISTGQLRISAEGLSGAIQDGIAALSESKEGA